MDQPDDTSPPYLQTCPDHITCQPCIHEAFTKALHHEIFYPPPSCCGAQYPMLMDLYLDFFDDAFVAQYTAAETEYLTPMPLRLYCANPSCAKFQHPPRNPPATDADAKAAPPFLSTCTHCGTTSCRYCKQRVPMAGGRVLRHQCVLRAEDDNDRRVDDLAARHGWKKCPQCLACIEKGEGCSHVQCAMCRYEFCFKCLRPWGRVHQCPRRVIEAQQAGNGGAT